MLRSVEIDRSRSAEISRRTCFCRRLRTIMTLSATTPNESDRRQTSSVVRMRSATANLPPGRSAHPARKERNVARVVRPILFLRHLHETVAGAVHGAEMHRIGGISFQLLAELQDLVIDRPGRWVSVVSPDFVE